ncbi:MAG: PDZ domain-containing protein [Clostridiales bacterium]|nr:PDZ domain-containing protein [Clostridiales bacterium]
MLTLKKLLAVVLILSILLASSLAFAAPLDEIYGIIEAHYIEEVNSRALRATALEDLGKFLNDPYSNYFSKEQLTHFFEGLSGEYGGIGVQIIQDGNDTVILSVFPGSPAEKAGIKSGDIIVSVDGFVVTGLPLSEVANLIRGDIGTSVVLELRRGSTIIKRIIFREQVDSPTVQSELMGDIGYIWIHTFSENTPKLFRNKLAALRQANPRGYILDLRDNPGGSLGAVLDVAEEFLPAGPMIIMNDRYGIEEVYGNIRDGAALPNLIVLVNGNSASASEILAGAVQDYQAGTLLGDQTFGKASVQTFFVLSDGSGLKLTTARYLTAMGQAIDKIGLTPDLVVSGFEEQLNEAVRRIRSTTSTLVFRIGSDNAWSTAGDIAVDAKPFIDRSRSYVPIRLLAETMGAGVTWNQSTKTVTIKKGFNVLEIPVGTSEASLNGKPYAMDTPILKEGRTFLPARAVAEALGGRVWWDAGKKEVVVAW